jgi:transcriptional regulator with XRE-family HTH domain
MSSTASPAKPGQQPNSPDLEELGAFIRDKREALGISQRELARRAGVADVTRVEQGQIAGPRTDTLTAIARALGLSLSELVGMGKPDSLPNFRPYMRAKYPGMTDAALADIDAHVQKLAKRHHISPTGPLDGEDEQDE